MTAYLIVYGADPTDRFAAYSYPTRAAAQRASLPASGLVPRVPADGHAGGCAYVVESETDAPGAGARGLLPALYNALTNSKVERFANRDAGAKRLLAALAEHAILGVDTPTQDATYTHDDYHLKDTTVTKKEEKAAAVLARKQEREAKKVAAAEAALAKKAEREQAKAAKAVEKATKTPRQPKPLGEFQQVRPSTNLGKIATAVVEGRTLSEIAAAVTMTEDEVKTHLKRARVTHGIDHTIEGDGRVSLMIPENAMLFKEPAAKPTAPAKDPTARRSKGADLDALAASGQMPDHIVITSAANLHRQKPVDKLEALVAAGDWDAVASFNMNGIDSYSKMINRHRDRFLAAHRAQVAQRAEAAE